MEPDPPYIVTGFNDLHTLTRLPEGMKGSKARKACADHQGVDAVDHLSELLLMNRFVGDSGASDELRYS